jgi:hypothetical protein
VTEQKRADGAVADEEHVARSISSYLGRVRPRGRCVIGHRLLVPILDAFKGFSFAKIITPDISQAEILPTGGEKQIFDFLKQTIQSWRDDPQRYVDVVVSKKKNIMLDLLLKVASGHAHGLPPA